MGGDPSFAGKGRQLRAARRMGSEVNRYVGSGLVRNIDEYAIERVGIGSSGSSAAIFKHTISFGLALRREASEVSAPFELRNHILHTTHTRLRRSPFSRLAQ